MARFEDLDAWRRAARLSAEIKSTKVSPTYGTLVSATRSPAPGSQCPRISLKGMNVDRARKLLSSSATPKVLPVSYARRYI